MKHLNHEHPNEEVGDQHATRGETRYGCFLPDLTGLARTSPAVVSRAEYTNPPRARKAPKVKSLLR